jgi:translation initiation factor eIF-2B subunit beta
MKKRLEKFVSDLKRRKVSGAYNVAVETAEIMFIGISSGNGHARQMMVRACCRLGSSSRLLPQLQEVVRAVGEQLVFASPLDLSIGNVMRRVLFIIREEYDEFASQMQSSAALGRSAMMRSSSMLSESLSMFAMEEVDSSYSEPFNLKGPVLEAVRTFIDDLRELHSSISQQALEHIHEHEVVLTFGRSRTVLEFFKAAARKRRFTVIVAETAPSFEGRQTALDLSREGIAATLVTDSAVFALMSRVNKVIIGVRAVLANGGLLAHSGAFLIAMAAKVHHVPLVVLSGLYKFTPLYPSEDQDVCRHGPAVQRAVV